MSLHCGSTFSRLSKRSAIRYTERTAKTKSGGLSHLSLFCIMPAHLFSLTVVGRRSLAQDASEFNVHLLHRGTRPVALDFGIHMF